MNKPQKDTDIKSLGLYVFICNYFQANLRVPTFRDIADEMSSSTSIGTYHVDRLIEMGLLERTGKYMQPSYRIANLKVEIHLPKAYYDALEAGIPVLERFNEG